MTMLVTDPAPGASAATLLRLGLRELRAGLRGFKIFIACLALGVMVIAAVGSLADSMRAGFARQGAAILGGDITFSRMHVMASGSERETFAKLGTVSETATLRTMARRPDGSEQALIELKGVDALYPLIGDVKTGKGPGLRDSVEQGGAVVDAMLLERLGLAPSDRMRIGEAEIEIKSVLKSEPDAVADRLTYGPRVFLSLATLEKTGLVKPGTLIKWRYAVKLSGASDADAAALKALRETTLRSLPQSGFTALDRHDPSPQITRTLDRLRQFLILIGLASLLVGGVGVANAVQTFIDKRIKVIATLRSLGASSREIISLLLVQILAMTAIGVAIGLILGMLVPVVINGVLGDALPIHTEITASPKSLLLAAAYGTLIALIFALWPLGQTEHVRASVLFRDSVQPIKGRPRTSIIAIVVALTALLGGMAAWTSEPHSLALYVYAALLVMLGAFAGLGQLITRLAQRMPRMRRPELAIAVRNAGAPDGLTRSVIVSLGTGLSLLVAVALANASLVDELKGRLPNASPDYFLLDVPKDEYAKLADFITAKIPGSVLIKAPMLRGRLIAIHGTPVEDIKAPSDVQWVLNGDRGLSYDDAVPEGSHVTQGTWWTNDYQGPPLVSFEGEIANKLGLKIGDTVTVNVLGRNVDATIANLREVKWQSLAINFVMVFSPNTLQSAPHNLLATIRLPKGTSSHAEVELVRDLAKIYPAISAIRVRDAIDQANKIFSKIMMAVQIAGGVTLAAGALVLAGALATAQRRRTLEAVILKTLGATRRQILTSHVLEYALLAIVAALVATALGALVAWIVVSRVFELSFVFSPVAVLQTLGVALALILTVGGLGTYAVLRAPSVPYLRTE
jgi:putative ABC transport system permease protein